MKKIIILFAVLVLCNFSYSQTVVSPGDGTLSAAIAAASDGDVLQLVSGEVYTESSNTSLGTLHKALTIEVNDNPQTAAPAIVRILTTGQTNLNFILLGDSSALTLRGIEFDGKQGTTATVSHLLQFTAGSTPTPGEKVGTVRVEYCNIHDLTGNVIDGGTSNLAGNLVVDSVLVDNVIMARTATSVYLKYCGCNYVSVTNSTFSTITSYGLRIAGPGYTLLASNTPTVLIDHTTWWKIGLTDPREIILLEKGPNLNPWTIKNSIFANETSINTSTRRVPINIKELSDTLMQHDSSLCLWEVDGVNWRGGVVADTITMDPQFADTTKDDFTLPKGSKLLTFGTDSGPIGDPRWATNFTSVNEEKTLPASFSLLQNYPNPFNPSTSIKFTLEKAGLTNLSVYNLLGQKVATILNGNLSSGEHSINFNASNLSSGIYIYQLTSGSSTISKKMILLK